MTFSDRAPRVGGMRQVAVGYPTTDLEMQRLSALLGRTWNVVDICHAPLSAEVVLIHRCSPQAVHNLRREFRRALIVVVEPAHESEGPDVCRCLSAGAAAHVLARSTDDVAAAVLGAAELAASPLRAA
jgi:hypothetical protein